MAENRDISKLSKFELTEMLQRQEKLLQNAAFLKSLPDRGQKVHNTVKKLKEMILKRGQAEDLTARFQQISITQSRKANPGQDVILDSDDDEDINDSISNMEDKNITAKESELSSPSVKDSKKLDKWAYESAVTYERKPKFEKSKPILLEESIRLQQTQKNEYEELRAKQATERLIQLQYPASSYSSLMFTTREAKDQYRDMVDKEEIQEGSQSESEDIQQQEESDGD